MLTTDLSKLSGRYPVLWHPLDDAPYPAIDRVHDEHVHAAVARLPSADAPGRLVAVLTP